MTLKASAHYVTFADQTMYGVSGNLEEMQFDCEGVEVFTLGTIVSNVGNTVSGMSVEFTGGFGYNASDFIVPIASVYGGGTISGNSVLLSTPTNQASSALIVLKDPPPLLVVRPYFSSWPASPNGSFWRVHACWR